MGKQIEGYVFFSRLPQATHDLYTVIRDESSFFVASLASHSPRSSESDLMAQVGAEYYAPCFTPDMLDQVSNARPGDLLFLALPVSENWRSLVDTNKTASVFVGPNPDPHVVDVRHSDRSISGRVHWAKDRPVFRKGMASKARSALYGKMVSLPTTAPYLDALHACFVQHHPDAEAWVPGSRKSPHVAQWVRFTPHRIYYVGGFGDEHYIGDLDMDMYRKTTEQRDGAYYKQAPLFDSFLRIQ